MTRLVSTVIRKHNNFREGCRESIPATRSGCTSRGHGSTSYRKAECAQMQESRCPVPLFSVSRRLLHQTHKEPKTLFEAGITPYSHPEPAHCRQSLGAFLEDTCAPAPVQIPGAGIQRSDPRRKRHRALFPRTNNLHTGYLSLQLLRFQKVNLGLRYPDSRPLFSKGHAPAESL